MNYCDDGGACHHNCADRSGQCYRRKCCEPLSNVFPNDEWPPSTGVEVHEFDPTKPKETPTPSITVGTQVRLTGVVRQVQPNGVLGVDVYVGCQDGLHWFKPSEVEVIRQPFKRGEVVYFEDHGIACVVLEDEQNGRMLLIEASEGKYATYVDAANYQRRP